MNDFLRGIMPSAPSLGPLAPIMTNWITMLLGIVWAFAIIYLAVHVLPGLAKAGVAKIKGRPHELSEALDGMGVAIIALILLATVPLWLVVFG